MVKLQMELLRLGRYEEAEKLSLQFSVDEMSVNQIERSIPGPSARLPACRPQ